MTRLLVLLPALVLLAAAGAGAAAGEAADTAAAAPPGEPSFFSWDYWLEGGNALRSEVVRNLGLLAAAVIGLVVGSWRAVTGYMQARASQRQAEAANEQAEAANEQARIAQQGQITDRFSTAVEHLGSGQLPVRLGGIYALWRLIQDSPGRDVTSVIDILCAFVRNPPPSTTETPETTRQLGDKGEDETDMGTDSLRITDRVRPDVQAILHLVTDRNADYLRHLRDDYRLDFSRANLARADLAHANLRSADLIGANLIRASLAGANLTDADLRGANLTDADLIESDLTYAQLMGGDLANADLSGARLHAARFALANLAGTRLEGAVISGADFSAADNMTPSQLYGIRFDPKTPPKLPPGLILPKLPPEPEAKSAAPPPPEA